jgi:antirestriction protein
MGERPAPRIYVASLSDYNAGRLHGVWLDAAQDADDLAEAVQQMLSTSREPVAEEYAIHDYEGFTPYQLGEYTPLTEVSAIACGAVEHGPAFLHYALVLDPGDRRERLPMFDDRYRGHWETFSQYAQSYLDDMGVDLDLLITDDWLRPYVRIDVESFADELASEFEISEGDGGVYVFELPG